MSAPGSQDDAHRTNSVMASDKRENAGCDNVIADHHHDDEARASATGTLVIEGRRHEGHPYSLLARFG